jgi:tetratricopeptide (TPR) repeat protein
VVGRILLLALLLTGTLWPQQDQSKQPPKPKTPEQTKPQPTEQEPPEEDESLAPKVYPFNPLEAEHDVQVGNYYFKTKKFKAAMGRFREATRYNPSYAEAYRRLGDSEEKLQDKQAANKAYTKFLELAPDAKEAEAVRKKLAGQR